MMTDDEIAATTVDMDVAKVALERAERRLADTIEARKTIETKGAGLFAAYIGLTMAICGLGAALAQRPEFQPLAPRLFGAALPFALGAVLFALVLWPTRSGFLGDGPEDWLRPGWIDAEKEGLGQLLAMMIRNIAQRLEVAARDLASKHRLLMGGLALGIGGMGGFAAVLYLTFLPAALPGA